MINPESRRVAVQPDVMRDNFADCLRTGPSRSDQPQAWHGYLKNEEIPVVGSNAAVRFGCEFGVAAGAQVMLSDAQMRV